MASTIRIIPSKDEFQNSQFVGINEPIKPFIRWAGGKQNIVKDLYAHLPKAPFNQYHEPFLGAGSLFLYSNFKQSHLSDINPHLISSYNWILQNPEGIHARLLFHKRKLTRDYYYKLRETFNKRKNSFNLEQASTFIFLVHTSFNGIYRVNQKGEYNVPFGKPNPALPELNHLKQISKKLESASITNSMYEDVLCKIGKRDFVYFDPPYPPLNETSFFQHYSISKFPNSQQEILASHCNNLSAGGAYIMISNAETKMIKKLYQGWNIKRIKTFRFVNCKAERQSVNELIITNY